MNELQTIKSEDYAYRVLSGIDARETTIRDYQYRIGEFLRYCDGRSFDNDTYLGYKRYLRDRSDWATATKDKYLISARVLLKEMHRLGALPVDITAGVKGFSVGSQHKRFGVSADEFKRLMLATKAIEDVRMRLRYQAMFIIAGFQGLREKEICALTVEDIDFGRGVAWVLGKGRDDKEKITLHSHTVKVLRRYLSVWKIRSGAVFVSVSNRTAGQPLSVRALREIMTDFMRANDVDASPHGFRKFFTTQVLKAFNGNPFKAKKFTRHANITTLQVYNDDLDMAADVPVFEKAFAL